MEGWTPPAELFYLDSGRLPAVRIHFSRWDRLTETFPIGWVYTSWSICWTVLISTPHRMYTSQRLVCLFKNKSVTLPGLWHGPCWVVLSIEGLKKIKLAGSAGTSQILFHLCPFLLYRSRLNDWLLVNRNVWILWFYQRLQPVRCSSDQSPQC